MHENYSFSNVVFGIKCHAIRFKYPIFYCKIRKVTAKICKCDRKIRNYDWNMIFKSCSHISQVAGMWQQFVYYCSHVTVIWWKLQSHFELWLQFVESCSPISNYDCNLLKVAITFRIMTAICWKLQSHFELWLQFVESCNHISNYDCNLLKFAVTSQIMTVNFSKLRSHLGLSKLSAHCTTY